MPVQNNRIYWPSQAVGIAKFSAPNTFTTVRGLQTAGLSARLNPVYVKEMGNQPTYASFEELPDVEITMEKALDGYAPLATLCTQDAPTAGLAGRSNQRCHVALSVHRDNQSRASGNQVLQAFASGQYLQSMNYTIPAEGFARESVTTVGNNLQWSTGSFTFTGHTAANGVSSLTPAYSGGVSRRHNILMSQCRFPRDLPGISSSGTNDPTTSANGDPQYSASIQTVTAAVSLNRNSANELGRKGPFFRFIEFPVDVTTTFEIIDKGLNPLNILEAGSQPGGDNTTAEQILIKLDEGLVLDLGSNNRLQSINRTGGDAGGRGSNVTLQLTYTNQDEMTVQHPADPTAALRP
jgi:hypothetical protein